LYRTAQQIEWAVRTAVEGKKKHMWGLT
jgi:hypothetical protein